MPKKKLLEDIKMRPSRFYRLPGDVARDRRFDDTERLEILQAWRGEDASPQVDDAIAEIEHRRAPNAAQ
jgi:hypothetical protein